MAIMDKAAGVIGDKGHMVVDKAKDLAEIAKLKTRILSCEEVIRKNYQEIGKLVYAEYIKNEEEDLTEAPGTEGDTDEYYKPRSARYMLDCRKLCEKQCTAISNAKKGIEQMQEQINKIKSV